MKTAVSQSRGNAPHKTGLWLAVMVILLVGGWRLLVIARQPADLMAIADEIGSIAQSKEGQFGEELVPNNSGTALVFYQETETGIGTYFCDVASGSTKLLFEQKEKGYNSQFGILGFSPDDSLFACNVLSDPNPMHPRKEIIFYDGISGREVAKIPADGYLSDSRFIWLSPHSFVFSTYNQDWLVFEQRSGGTWIETQVIKRFTEGKLINLAVTSTHSIVWQQDGNIWTFDFASDSKKKIWESGTNQLEDFIYSEETGQFLLICRDENGPFSIDFRPPRLGEKQGSVLNVTRKNLRTKYADLNEDHGRYCFTIKIDTNVEQTCFVWEGMVEYYKLGGDYLYFTGNRADGPPGIWQYDIKSKAVRCLASGLKHDFKHTRMVTPLEGMITNTVGNQVGYHVWVPTHMVPGKKYPLIIGQTHYMWFSYQQVAANGGYFFASVDRLSWWAGLDDWENDVMGLYKILAKTPNIDTNRVFLFSTSVESSYLAPLVEGKPGLWNGVVLFNPVALPDLQNVRFSKMFIASGTDDGNATERLTKYQDEAARSGVRVKLVLQDGVQHITRSIATERERTRQFARFLLENQ